MKIHIVQKGDTLWKIAKKYGVSYEMLKKMNSQLSNPDMLMPGMKIKIPENASAPAKKWSDTKVNFGTVKEAPISGGNAYMKESIKPETKPAPSKDNEMPIKTPQAAKEMPKQQMDNKKEKPIKEKPKMPYVAPQAIVKPVIPEIDINNYYLMNMPKMEMQTPPPMPNLKEQPKVKEKPKVKEQPKVKEKPIVKEKPKKMEKPKPKPMPMPMPMPQYMPEYCPPMIPYYDPCCAPVMMYPSMPCPPPYFNQPYMTAPAYHQPYHQSYWGQGNDMEDSTTFHTEQHESGQVMGMQGEYHPQQQGYHPVGTMTPHGQYPVQGMQGYFQHPGYGHYGYESAHYGMESPGHMMEHSYQQQQQYVPFDGYVPQGCGCPESGAHGTFYQPMNQYYQQGSGMDPSMNQYQQQGSGMGHSINQYHQQESGMGHSLNQYHQQESGMGHSMNQYHQQGSGMGHSMNQYHQQGSDMGHSMNQFQEQGQDMSQPMNDYTQQGMNQPMYQQAVQQPYYQDPQFHQRYGGQEFESASPSYNPNAQYVIPHIEPATFDMPRTQEESSEQEGQS